MTELYAVAGSPVFHSLSPEIFNSAFTVDGTDSIYLRLAAESALEVMNTAAGMKLAGLNITAPFKEEIAGLIDEVDETSQRIGAVNTVKIKNSRSMGYNTDPSGVIAALESTGTGLEMKKAVVLGAGGASAAAVFALITGRMKDIVIVNRSEARAERLARRFGVSHVLFEDAEDSVREADIIVSCLPAGAQPLRKGWLRREQVLLDAGYTESSLKQTAVEAGLKYSSGLGWLVAQASHGFSIFTGRRPPVSVMRNAVEAAGGSRKIRPGIVVLTGMMGTGKTETGRALARIFGYDFIDADEAVEKASGKSIGEIFSGQGEEAFRKIESEQVEQALQKQNTVVALGGGAVLDPVTLDLVSQTGCSVWLWADSATCADRIKGTKRPLLSGHESSERLEQILMQRKHLYAHSCDMVVSTVDRTAQQAAERIADEIGKSGPR